MDGMKRLSFAFGATVLALTLIMQGAANPRLSEVKNVYMLPMANALDQFLAIRLTNGGLLQVVTDPQKADAVFTDHIGGSFEQKLDDLYSTKPAGSEEDALTGATSHGTMQPLSRSKGTIFLVDRKTRNLLWSTYVQPKGNSADQVKQVADRVVSEIEKDLKGK
jgi:hypothetical protein